MILVAGQALAELSKDKPSIKQMDQQTSSFLKTLNHVEIEMAKHINYLTQVSTGKPCHMWHEVFENRKHIIYILSL